HKAGLVCQRDLEPAIACQIIKSLMLALLELHGVEQLRNDQAPAFGGPLEEPSSLSLNGIFRMEARLARISASACSEVLFGISARIFCSSRAKSSGVDRRSCVESMHAIFRFPMRVCNRDPGHKHRTHTEITEARRTSRMKKARALRP